MLQPSIVEPTTFKFPITVFPSPSPSSDPTDSTIKSIGSQQLAPQTTAVWLCNKETLMMSGKLYPRAGMIWIEEERGRNGEPLQPEVHQSTMIVFNDSALRWEGIVWVKLDVCEEIVNGEEGTVLKQKEG